MNDHLGPLRGRQTVVIIGGGPAGSSCGIMSRRLARKKGMPLQVFLFESRDFYVEPNVCVSVLSPPFGSLLAELELTLPRNIVQRHIKGYMLHSATNAIYLEDKSEGEPTLVVDRADLDTFLLESARRAGVTIVEDTVVDVRPGLDNVLVVGSGGTRILADVVVGAFGLHSSALSIFEGHVQGYERPKMTRSILTEMYAPTKVIDARLHDTIHALLVDTLPGVEFGALTPKHDLVTVNIAGDNITDEHLDTFLSLPWIRKLLPEATLREPRYHNVFPSSPAHNLYSDRIVTIGNTSGLLRPLKGKGINTSIRTGIEAAKTMLDVGISKKAFDIFYERCSDLTSEYYYGLALRYLYHFAQRLRCFDALIELAKRDPLMYQMFYDMVSGEGSYRQIIRRSARVDLLGRILWSVVRYRALRPGRPHFPSHSQPHSP